MRKVNPDDVRAELAQEIADLVAYFDRTVAAVAPSPNAQADTSRLAETTFLSVFVAFERFMSDLFLAYLNRQFSTYRTDLEGRMRQSIEQRYGPWAATHMSLGTVAHVRLTDLESLVDPDGRNLAFGSAQDLRDKAQQWLAPAYRARIAGLTPHDDRLLDTARAIRDFIAHRSKAAKDRMNQSLATVVQGVHNANLGRGAHAVQSVGSFLKAVFDGQRRVAGYAARLRDIAARM